ncbi:MAG: hypothetical protein HN521_18155, partial [Candidatus Latescibacteria bacterium]|nr:hypothetical protein [Candidatus Latescibacterota bacterium]
LSSAWQVESGSELLLSTKHYKSGRQSLKWTWQGSSGLVFEDPAQSRTKTLTGFRA